MKSKFLAGLVATLVSLVFVIGAAIFATSLANPRWENGLVKLAAGLTILIWLGLYSWLKPKPVQTEADQNNNEVKAEEQNKDRNSYR